MSCCSKEKMERNDYNDTCKSHSAKSDREMYRICPSKLSKRELEDLYFTLLENNLELKKTINRQQDKIRVLSTQVQRMTNTHEKMISKEMKECSTETKAFVNEQKDFIIELKETNQRMAERIQQLNMRLCSAKQFSKMTPPQTSNSRRFRSAIASPSKKHNYLTKDQVNEQVFKLSTSSQWEDRSPRKTTQTEIIEPLEKTPRETTQTQIIVPLEKSPPKSDQLCDENKCKSLMEELKVKIVTLQDELFHVHDEYSTRIGRLEAEVSEVRKENIRVCSERSASDHELQNTVKRTTDILAQYRLSEAKCSELTTELAIEKRKVAELETLLKATNMSDKVNKTIEEHLTTIQETNGAPDDCLLKLNCGCPPPHLSPRERTSLMNEKAPIKTLSLLSPPKRRDSEDHSAKTTYSPRKGSSSTSQQIKSSPTKTSSENTQCDMCGCTPAKNTSTPRKASKKDIECCCPDWVKFGILQSLPAQTQDVNASCIKCCFKDKHGATESPPSKNSKFLSPRGATTRSPSEDKDGTKPSNTGDDSGYQDTDELVLHKQNRELMTKILQLQNQVDCMKIRMCEMSEAKPGKLSKSTGSPKITTDYAAVATAAAPLLGELAKLKIPEEQIEYNKSIEGGHNESKKQGLFPHLVSEERVNEPGKILSIENLGNPKAAGRTRKWDDTRAKTTEDANDTLQTTEETSFDKFSPQNLINDDNQEHTDSPKPRAIEKKKLEILATSNVSGPRFNPEKVKYLEAEGVIARLEFGEDMSKLKKDSVSLDESVPSNSELGFGIPKAESDSVRDKKSPARSSPSPQQARDDIMEVLHGKLKLPMNEEPKQKDATKKKKKEDCENCDACSFDKQCELKHENATEHRMNKLAPGMQKEQTKKHDQHNSLQIPGPMPTSDSNKKEKMKNLLSHFMKDRSSKQKKEDFISNPKIYGQQKTATTDVPTNPDPKFAEKSRQLPTNVGIQASDKEELKSPRDQRRPLLTSERGTYTVNSKQSDASPDNTDLEMSDLSDLPMEKEKKSIFKSRSLSPGEDRTTTFTSTHSYYSPPTSWLSEGEMPATTSKRKHSKPDKDKPYLNDALAHNLETPPSQQMEAALQAISEELRRCRSLLHAHRVAEVTRLPSAVL